MSTAHAIAISAAYSNLDPHAHPLQGSLVFSNLSPPDQYGALIGRILRPTPPQLTSRVLYIPSHNDKITHLPVYDFTGEFKEAVKDEPIGSSRFKTSFGLMHKPIGDGRGTSSVSYLADFDPLESRTVVAGPDPGTRRKRGSLLPGQQVVTKATVRRRMLGGGAEVGLTIPPARVSSWDEVQDGAVGFTITPSSTTVVIPVVLTFPINPVLSKYGCTRNPWFTFTVPNLLDAERTFQWQTHPTQHGMLRYTLVEIPGRIQTPYNNKNNITSTDNANNANNADDTDKKDIPFSAFKEENESLIRAIYHNVGLGYCLAQPFSEGALLLQDDLDPELEALVVASLIGLLWTARNEQVRPSPPSTPPRKGSKSEGNAEWLKPRKGSVGEGGGGAAPTQMGSKKGLIRKLLRKK